MREAQANEIRSILGDEGVADWQNIADLAATDQTAAARAFAQLRGKVLAQNQTQPPTAPPVGSTQPAMAGGGMFPTRGVDANAPLGQPSADNSWAAVAAEAEARFQTQVARQQGSLQDRSRFTGKDRREGIMDYLASAYAKVMGERQASGRR